MGVIKGVFALGILATLGSGGGLWWLAGTPLTPDNVETRLIAGCRVFQAAASVADVPPEATAVIERIDCNCVARRVVDRHGTIFAADVMEKARQELVHEASQGRSGSAISAMAMVAYAPKFERLRTTLLSAHKFCAAGGS